MSAIASFSLLAACAGNGQGLDSNGRPLLPGGGPPPPLAATFASIQENIFTPICSVCHAGGAAPEGLRLDAANSYDLLVGVPSTEVPALLRVKPGDPDNSYIIQKLEGHAAVGAQMPFGCPATQPCLSTATIAFIRQWIIDGAARSATADEADDSPLTVASVVPNDSDAISGPLRQVMIAFSHEIDAAQILSGSARIEKIGTDAAGADDATIPARLTLPGANPRTLLIWPVQSLPPGRYRVIINSNDLGEAVISTFEVLP